MMRQNHILKQPALGHPGQRPDKEPNLAYEPQLPYIEKQASRDLEQPSYRYEVSSYTDQFSRNYDHRLRFEDRIPTYEDQWSYYDDKQPYQPRPFENQHPRDLDSRQHPEEASERGYFQRFEEPAPLSYDSRTRYEQLPRTSTLRHEEQPAPAYEVHNRYRPEAQPYSSTGPKSSEPKQYFDQYPRSYEQVPPPGFTSKTGHYEPLHGAAVVPPLIPSSQQKPEVLPSATKPQPPPLPSQYSQPAPPLSSSSLHIHSKGAQGEGNSVSLDFQNSYMSKPDPPPSQSKPATFRPPTREDPPQTFYPQKSFPDKAPVNGAEQTQKTITPVYNRFTPKPYTSSARPFERKFESPKFNHNLLPSETVHKPELSSKTPTSPKTLMKAHSSTQPPEFDSGVETFSVHTDKPKYQMNNISTMPKAVPVSPSAVEEDEDEDGHTVVATARGIFNSNGGVLSSIETGVSIIIPQGAIPEGIEQEIYFKVCRDNSILPPLDKEKGETLLSPLVMCGPHGLKFLKPVELRLPHCASMTPDGWSFALKSSDSSSGDPKTWQNKCLPGDPNYLVGANCVSVLIDHF